MVPTIVLTGRKLRLRILDSHLSQRSLEVKCNAKIGTQYTRISCTCIPFSSSNVGPDPDSDGSGSGFGTGSRWRKKSTCQCGSTDPEKVLFGSTKTLPLYMQYQNVRTHPAYSSFFYLTYLALLFASVYILLNITLLCQTFSTADSRLFKSGKTPRCMLATPQSRNSMVLAKLRSRNIYPILNNLAMVIACILFRKTDSADSFHVSAFF